MTSTWDPVRLGANLQDHFGAPPDWAVVLGSGLGAVSRRLGVEGAVPYQDLGLPQTGVAGHSGSLGVGTVAGKRIAVLAGRVHAYEGHGAAATVASVRALAQWGVPRVVLTSAVGSLRRDLLPGTIVRITDHINLMGWNPLTGPNDDRVGPRFPDLSHAYDPELATLVQQVAGSKGLALDAGVYCGMSGPSYESAAEVRMLGLLGGDVVGMSMVPEVIAAVHAGRKVLGLAVVSNLGTGLSDEELDHHDVTEVVGRAASRLAELLAGVVEAP